jgi:hypothetical protein
MVAQQATSTTAEQEKAQTKLGWLVVSTLGLALAGTLTFAGCGSASRSHEHAAAAVSATQTSTAAAPIPLAVATVPARGLRQQPLVVVAPSEEAANQYRAVLLHALDGSTAPEVRLVVGADEEAALERENVWRLANDEPTSTPGVVFARGGMAEALDALRTSDVATAVPATPSADGVLPPRAKGGMAEALDAARLAQ